MSEINLDVLRKIMPRFMEWLASDYGAEAVSERANKTLLFNQSFSKEAIHKIDEGTLRDLIRSLWAFNGWTNKDWLVGQMMQSGLPQIRTSFERLLYSKEPISARFDGMRTIYMMGAASISEILAQHDPTKYAIWNRRARNGLVHLGVHQSLIPKSHQITGTQYENFCSLMQKVLIQIRNVYPELRDLLELDFLLYYVSFSIEETRLEPQEQEKFEHDVAINQVLQLGDGLGFDVQKELSVTKGCRVDAVWRSRIANLGVVTYAFEVHKSGSRDSAILNLQRIAKADPSVQKLVIVSTEGEIEEFKEEITSLPEEFRNMVGYFPVKDLQNALEHQVALKNILANIGLGLLKGRIEITE
jgi:hypothetical protein